MAYKKFIITTRDLYKKAMMALQERFKSEAIVICTWPNSRHDRRGKTKTWPEFEGISSISRSGWSHSTAAGCAVIFIPDQVVVDVRQRKTPTTETAASATLGVWIILGKINPEWFTVVAPVQTQSTQMGGVLEILTQLMAQMVRLEENSRQDYVLRVSLDLGNPRVHDIKYYEFLIL